MKVSYLDGLHPLPLDTTSVLLTFVDADPTSETWGWAVEGAVGPCLFALHKSHFIAFPTYSLQSPETMAVKAPVC
jgi:hypothetical protein